jgi:hypothetical protein
LTTAPETENLGYEKKDINIVRVIGTAIAILIILIVIIIALSDFFMAEKEQIVYEQTLKPQSQLLQELRSKENETLTTYKLLDPVHGVYRIPIERAMELLVQEAGKKNKE